MQFLQMRIVKVLPRWPTMVVILHSWTQSIKYRFSVMVILTLILHGVIYSIEIYTLGETF